MKITKNFLLIITLTVSIMIIGGCNSFNEVYNFGKEIIVGNTKEVEEKTIEQLSLKYGCDFTATEIGNRIDRESADLYLYPNYDNTLTFKATLNTETGEVSDNLIRRIVQKKFADTLCESLGNFEIDATASVLFLSESDFEENNLNISLEEYIQKYNVHSASIYMSVNKETVTEFVSNDLIESCRGIANEYGMDLVVYGFVYSDNYNSISEEQEKEPDIVISWFKDNSPQNSFKFAIVNGECNVSEEELKKSFY